MDIYENQIDQSVYLYMGGANEIHGAQQTCHEFDYLPRKPTPYKVFLSSEKICAEGPFWKIPKI